MDNVCLELRAALQGLMDMISIGTLARTVDRDRDMKPGWAERQMPLISALKAARNVLEKTKELR